MMLSVHESRCTHHIEGELLGLLGQGPLSQTSLMFEVRLNSKDIKRYVDYLLSSGFVSLEQISAKRNLLRITEKGRTRLGVLKEACA